jgi:hypothetical protein
MARELYSVFGTNPVRVGTPGVQRSDFQDFTIHGPVQMNINVRIKLGATR